MCSKINFGVFFVYFCFRKKDKADEEEAKKSSAQDWDSWRYVKEIIWNNISRLIKQEARVHVVGMFSEIIYEAF